MSTSAAGRKVPFGQKVAFGLGMLANQMFPAALGIFMVVLVQDMGFPTWMWGVLFFLPRAYDAILDPIMGFISDNTRSKWGRRRQYVFIGAIMLGIGFVAMWQMYRTDGIPYNFAYFLFWSLVFFTGLTVFSIPYVAMGYEMSDDFHERTSIMAVAQWIGQWAWVIAPWFWVVMYDPKWFPNADTAARTLSVWVGVPCMLLAMVPALFLPSRSTQNDTHLIPLTVANIGTGFKELLAGFKEAFGCAPFRKLCVATFLIFNAFNTVAAFSFFIVVYHLFNGNTAAAGIWPTLFGSVGALITTFAVIPTVAWMSRKVGKKKAFMLSQGVSILGYILLWLLMVPWQALDVHVRAAVLFVRHRRPVHADDVDDGRRVRPGRVGHRQAARRHLRRDLLVDGEARLCRRRPAQRGHHVLRCVHARSRRAARGGRGRPAPVLFRRAHSRHVVGDVVHARLRPGRGARRRGACPAGAAQERRM